MSDPLFSVIIPAYGRAAMVADAVASVLDQTIDSFECLVVDDASPEPVAVPADPRVSVIRRPVNGGTAASRNTGIEAASGDAVLFLDDDDLFAPDRLQLARDGLERADVAVCWVQYVDGPPRRGRTLDGDVSGELLESLVPNMGQTATRRSVAPRFDEGLRCCEDVEWWVRTCQALEVATTPAWGLRYRRHAGIREGKSLAERAAARTAIMSRHAEFFAARPRSAAFQWKRIGILHEKAGDRNAARKAYATSLRIRPSVRTLSHVLRPGRDTAVGGVAA